MNWIVSRTKDGLSAREEYPGIYLAMKADPDVLEWWEIEAVSEKGAKDAVRAMFREEGEAEYEREQEAMAEYDAEVSIRSGGLA